MLAPPATEELDTHTIEVYNECTKPLAGSIEMDSHYGATFILRPRRNMRSFALITTA